MDAFVFSIAVLDWYYTHTNFCNPPDTEKNLYIVLKKQNISHLISRQKTHTCRTLRTYLKTKWHLQLHLKCFALGLSRQCSL